MSDGIEFRLRYILDSQPFDRAVSQSTANALQFDSALSRVERQLAGVGAAAQRSAQAQGAAATGGQSFVAALERELAALRERSLVLGKSEGDARRAIAADRGVAQQAEATITAIDAETRALARRGVSQQVIDTTRNVSARDAERRAVEQGIAVDIRAGRAKEELIREIERETAALTKLASVPRGAAISGGVVDRVQAAAAEDPTFAARAQVPLQNLATARGAARAAQDASRLEAEINRLALTAGKTRAEILRMDLAAAGLGGKFEAQIAKIAAVDKQFQSFNKTGRLTALELQQVGFQLNDFAVQVASGQNVLTAFVQQGSQLSGTFGGIGNAVRALRSLVTPTVLAIGGLAAGAGAFALAARSTEQWTRALADLQATLQGTGRGGQFSNSALSKLIEDISQAPGITREAATKSVAELARASKIGADLFGEVSKAAIDYARITGTDLPAATKTLVTALSDPAEGAKNFEQSLGTLSAGTLATITRLERLGDRLGAQRTLLDAIRDATRDAARIGLTPLQEATNNLGNAWDRLTNTFRESEGLQQALTGISKLVDGAATLVKLLDDIDKKFPKSGSLNPAGDIGAALADRTRRALGLSVAGDVKAGGGGQFAGARGGGGSFDAPGGAGGSFAEGPEVGIRSESQAREDLLKRVQQSTASYRSEARELEELKGKRSELTNAIKVAVQQGYAPDSQVIKDFEDRIVAVNKRIADAGSRGGGNLDRGLKRDVAAAIELARRQAETIKAQVAAQNEDLRAQYDAGEIDLATYYRKRVELADELAASEQTRLEAVIAAQQRLRDNARDPKTAGETREAAGDAIDSAFEQQARARADAERNRTSVAQDGKRLEAQLTRALIDQQIELAQLSGDEFAAETLRNSERLKQARLLAAARGTPEAQAEVGRLDALLKQRADLNQLQREASRVSTDLQAAEDAYRISATARGTAQEDIEQALFDIRREQLPKLEELALRARRFAETSKDPAVLDAARQLELQWRAIAEAVTPAVQRLREFAETQGQAAARNITDAIIDGDFRKAGQNIARDIVRGILEEDVTRPLSKWLTDAIKGSIGTGEGGAGGTILRLLGLGGTNQATSAPGFAGGTIDLGNVLGAIGAGAGTPSTPSAARDKLRRIEAAIGGGAATVPSATPVEGAQRATTALDELARAATDAAQALGGGAGEARGASGFLQRAFNRDDQIRIDTSGAGTPSTPSVERDILRRIEAGTTAEDSGEAVDPLRKAIDETIPSFADLVQGARDAAGGLSGLPQLLQSLLSGLGGSVGSIFSGIGTFFGFEEGGFTGAGAKLEPAGVVHRGEYVQPQERVAETGALRFMERFREVGMRAVDETFTERIARGVAGEPAQIILMERLMRAGASRGFSDGGLVGEPAIYDAMPTYASGGLVAGLDSQTAMQRQEPPMRRLEAPSANAGRMDFSQSNHFYVTGAIDKRTQEQIAVEVGRRAARGANRGTA